ncbi:MAG: alpha-amylase family glycosyl hydrolase [Bacteroidota bacterium]
MIRRKYWTLYLLLLLPLLGYPQSLSVDKIEPPNWWVGMEWDTLQVMVYGNSLNEVFVSIQPEGPQIIKTHLLKNDNYAIVELYLPPDLRSQNYELVFHGENTSIRIPFPLLEKNKQPYRIQGFDASDVVYLITPDRFADGDSTNQRAVGIQDEYYPSRPGMRHGGDLQGIMDHLDYLEDLGITALWLNPVLENAGKNSYHGYACTDLYRIDPRLGTNELYRELVDSAHQKGIKVIFDHINNHIGIKHPWMSDLPMEDWVNGSIEEHYNNKHYKKAISDPYADSMSKEMLNEFWFVDGMPDLNQHNPFLAKYLIQNTLWWIEYAGIDGIREDTYPYPFQDYMADWAKAVITEYPSFNIVGEIWDMRPSYLARFQQGTLFRRSFDSHLPSLMDFPLSQAFRDFIRGEGRLRDVYEVYADDFVYADPQNLMVFLDNHDMTRAIFEAEKRPERVKLALAFLLTARGIPQLFYGTEINLYGGKRHIDLREDFPGGFPYHTRSAFTQTGRSAYENDMFDYLQKLLKLRKKHPALSVGKLTHYPPIDEIYMYLKEQEGEQYWIIANGNEEKKEVPLWDIQHKLEEVVQLENLLDDTRADFSIQKGIDIQPMEVKIFRLLK